MALEDAYLALEDAYLKAVWGNAPDPQWLRVKQLRESGGRPHVRRRDQ
jgi:hypothetical protein